MMPMNLIANVIQLAIGPIFLLVGTGSFLNVMTARLGRVVDRARALEDALDSGETGPIREAHTMELKYLDKRIRHANWAITLCVISALLICVVVALLFLGELFSVQMRLPIASLFILTVMFLIAGLIQFLREIAVATTSLRVRAECLRGEGAGQVD